MALRKINLQLLEQIKLDRQNLTAGALSSTHVMSKEDYLSIYEKLFNAYGSVNVSYNEKITNEEEQVVIVIGI